ncbi:hypothetical protein AMECASPLE_036879 [Ameca splendens]|uniref:Uncharacterized protein n=1 Tax=Ameca splendens TaxID=208324 RepID=A0ABV0ZGH9_9TELE
MSKTNPFYSPPQQSSQPASLISEAGARGPPGTHGPGSGLEGAGTDPVGSVALLLSGSWRPDRVSCPNPFLTPTPCYTSTPAVELQEIGHSIPQEDGEDRADPQQNHPEDGPPIHGQTVVQLREHLARKAAAKPEGFSYATKANYPLLQQQGSGAPRRYKPFSLGDITALCDKLPPITEGAAV